MIARALNQKTAPELPFAAFLDLAQQLGCTGIEARDDLGRPFFDGLAPEEAGAMVRARGLRLLGLSEVYPFNDWSEIRAAHVQALIDTAQASGAETVSLIPRVDGGGCEDGLRQQVLRDVIREVLAMLEGRSVVPLIEPIGFSKSSLRHKAELVEALEATGATGKILLLHDTFQHCIAGETEVFAPWTGMVHLSGLSEPGVALDERQDAHRILVDAGDRCDTLEQIAALRAGGYEGAYSFECTAGAVQTHPDPAAAIDESFRFIETRLSA
ncbi:TIM barrel protein [Pseudooceanicola endophyticus]|nr:TIM barrel protein [Pseudooceanicola endophyticus]